MSQSNSKKKTGLIIGGVLVWALLMGGAVALALINKPEPEVVHTNDIIEAYKFSGANRAAITDTVDDVDYYGTYTQNQIVLTKITEGKCNGAYTISGLKNKAVEEAINNRILAVAAELSDLNPERGFIAMEIGANYYNILSANLFTYTKGAFEYVDRNLTFDLNTGKELTFDDLFPEGINHTSLFFNSVYSTLMTSMTLNKKDAEMQLSFLRNCPDPNNCQYPYGSVDDTIESVTARIQNYDQQMANIENVVYDTVQNYLAGEKNFYLHSYGPAIKIASDRYIFIELKDNIRYATYLKKYRSDESLYENDHVNDTALFFTEDPAPDTTIVREEGDNYILDFMMYDMESPNMDLSPAQIRQALTKYAKEKSLTIGDNSKEFHYIMAYGNAYNRNNLRIAYSTVTVYSMDKSYYESTFRKAIIDGKNQDNMGGQPGPHVGEYDESKISIADNQKIYSEDYALTKSGEILENLDDIITVKPEVYDWKKNILASAYSQACYNSYEKKCYTEAEKKTHKIIYSWSSGYFTLRIDRGPGQEPEYLTSINGSYIPITYYNPEIVIQP